MSNDEKISPLERERIASMAEIRHLTGLSRDTIVRHHGNKLIRLSARRVGMKIKDVLALAVPKDAA
jgi:hypothetical protein